MDRHCLMFLTLVTAALSHPVSHPGYEVSGPITAGGTTQTRVVTQEEVVRTSGVQTNPGGIALPVQPIYQQGLPGQTVYQPGLTVNQPGHQLVLPAHQPGYQLRLPAQQPDYQLRLPVQQPDYQTGLTSPSVYQAGLRGSTVYQADLPAQPVYQTPLRGQGEVPLQYIPVQ
uniref:Uncharacterized protein n=1 Tax=Timema cristinae TaxID=61476 RepID=A0A7R9D4R9_TIMCR|nr:unnamed protein product [Timema cristinae]